MKKLKDFLIILKNKFFSIFGKSYLLGYKFGGKYPKLKYFIEDLIHTLKVGKIKIKKTKNFLVYLFDLILDFLSLGFLISLLIILRKNIFLLIICLHLSIRMLIIFLDNLGELINYNILKEIEKKLKNLKEKTKFKYNY